MNDAGSVLRAAEQALQERWPGAVLDEPALLDGSDRNMVIRARVAGAPVASVVVNVHLPGEQR